MNILADILVILAWFNNVICVCFAFEEKTCVCTSYMCAFQRYIYIYTVASMLLIFPCVRLDCVSSASKTCLDYVWSANVFMLSV